MALDNNPTTVEANDLRSAFVLFTDGPVAPGGCVPGAEGHWIGDTIPGGKTSWHLT